MNLREYQTYNRQFSEEYIYRLGGNTGFFSEYNNMIITMLYCIIHKKCFILQSKKANFSSGQGWSEYFLPFIDEIYDSQLNRYNKRKKTLYKNKLQRIIFNLYKLVHPKRHYTYNFFETVRKMPTDLIYDVPELNLKGNLQECCSSIHKMIWRYNKSTQSKIDGLIADLNLPKEYLAIHVRCGDKITETNLYDPEEYFDKASIHSKIKNVFVLTDDYRVIKELSSKHPDYQFYTLCQEDEVGYNLEKLLSQTRKEQELAMLRLWASMDIMENAIIFVGTFNANPGMNMGFRLPNHKLIGLDNEHWYLW